jgi:cell division septal protein FtsQ
VAYRRARPKALRIPWRLIVPLLVVLGIALWMVLGNAWFLMPDTLSVQGASSPQMKKDVMIASDLLGWHRFMLKPRQAEARIMEALPQLEAATVTCALFPTSCEVAIAERVPVLVWIDGTDIHWVDRHGVVFPAEGQGPGQRPNLPIVRGPLPDVDDTRAFSAVQQGIAALDELGLPTDSLEYNPQRGLIWVDAEGRRIAFGVGPNMTARWQAYEALIAHLESKGVFPWTVDVRFPGGITYSLERSW